MWLAESTDSPFSPDKLTGFLTERANQLRGELLKPSNVHPHGRDKRLGQLGEATKLGGMASLAVDTILDPSVNARQSIKAMEWLIGEFSIDAAAQERMWLIKAMSVAVVSRKTTAVSSAGHAYYVDFARQRALTTGLTTDQSLDADAFEQKVRESVDDWADRLEADVRRTNGDISKFLQEFEPYGSEQDAFRRFRVPAGIGRELVDSIAFDSLGTIGG